MRLTNREADIQKAALEMLAMRGFHAFRVNSGKVQTKGGHWITMAPAGTADIIGWVPVSGRFLALEVKRPGGKRRPGQAEFLAAVRAAGGVGLFVEDVGTLYRVLCNLAGDSWAKFDEEGRRL